MFVENNLYNYPHLIEALKLEVYTLEMNLLGTSGQRKYEIAKEELQIAQDKQYKNAEARKAALEIAKHDSPLISRLGKEMHGIMVDLEVKKIRLDRLEREWHLRTIGNEIDLPPMEF